jgi:hypothetical protein
LEPNTVYPFGKYNIKYTNSTMDSVFGFEGSDFVLLCADRTSARSIVAFKHDEDKVRVGVHPMDTNLCTG